MSENTISILNGSTFLVSALNGDIDAGPTQGGWFLRFFAFSDDVAGLDFRKQRFWVLRTGDF